MAKIIFAGVIAVALTAGSTFTADSAYAQTASADTATSTVTTGAPTNLAPPVPPGATVTHTYTANKTVKTVDSDGTETDKSVSYSSDASGTKVNSTAVVKSPDGAEVSTAHSAQAVAPDGTTTTVTNQSTTTTGQ